MNEKFINLSRISADLIHGAYDLLSPVLKKYRRKYYPHRQLAQALSFG